MYDENNNGDGVLIAEGKLKSRHIELADESDSESSECSEDFDRHFVSAVMPQKGNSKRNWEYIGREFIDPDESFYFIVDDVCNAQEEGYKLLFFKI